MSDSPYSLPEIYEIAFSFRDYPKAVDFLIEATTMAGCGEIRSMLEIGCGPGQYCREFAKRGTKSTGLDLAPEMVSYLDGIAKNEKLPLVALEADMRNFNLSEPVDLAVCMMDTASIMLTNKDMVDHLNAVAESLTSDGVYIMELGHPRGFYTADEPAGNVWTMEHNGTKVHTNWLSESVTDPLTETDRGIVTYTVERDGKTEIHKSDASSRMYSVGLMRALIELSGRFKIAMMYGDVDVAVPFDNDKKAWRMVLVLRKYL